jgi:hypothetical protein
VTTTATARPTSARAARDGWGPDRTPAGWWGLCHAWTPASILEPEAINPVTVNGVTFDRSDIHALIMTVYDRNEALMLGGRCNADEFTPDNINRGANEECNDTNPGAMHVVLANFLGIADQAIAFDRTAGAEVWNQPIYSYEVTQQDEVTAAKANECVGASGSTWSFNSRARKLYEVRSNVEYVVEGGASKRVLAMTDYLSSDSYHYILEVGTYGKVIGGRWCSDSADSHPDFMWAPKKAATSNTGRNPGVSLEKVRELLNKSVNGDTGGGGGGGTPGTDFAGRAQRRHPRQQPDRRVERPRGHRRHRHRRRLGLGQHQAHLARRPWWSSCSATGARSRRCTTPRAARPRTWSTPTA